MVCAAFERTGIILFAITHPLEYGHACNINLFQGKQITLTPHLEAISNPVRENTPELVAQFANHLLGN